MTWLPTAITCGAYTTAVAAPAAMRMCCQARFSTPGNTKMGVTLVARASPSSAPPSMALPSVRARASTSSAMAVSRTPITSLCASFPASKITVGHHAQSTARRGSRPSLRSPNSSTTVVSTAHKAIAACMGVELSSPAIRYTAVNHASATGG